MANQNDVYELEVKANADGVTAVSKALDDVDDKGEKAESSIRKLGAQTDQCGTKATNLGTTWGDVGKAFGTRVKAPFVKTFDAIKNKTQEFGTKFKTTTKNMGDFIKHPIERIKTGLLGALQNTKEKTEETEDSAKKMGSQLEVSGSKGENGLNKILGALKAVAAAALALKAAQAVGNFIKDCVGASEEMASSVKSLDAILGENSAAANEWAENYGNAANRSAKEVKGFMVESAAMYNQMGLSSDAVTKLSESTTALSYDLAATFKVGDDEMFSSLTSAIGGSDDALSKFGVKLDETTLKRTAAGMGIKGEISKLDDATAAQVRYQAILEQTEAAQLGAFNATGDYTNGIKGIQGVYENFMTTVGDKFAPMLGQLFDKVLEIWPKIEPALMGVVDLLVDGLGEAIPIIGEIAEEVLPVLAETIGTVFTAIKPLIPIFLNLIKTLLPPFAKLIQSIAENLLPPLVSVIELVLPPLVEIVEALLPPLMGLIEAIAPPLMELINGILPPLTNFITQLIPPILQIVDAILPPLIDIIDVLIPPVVQIVEALLPPLLDVINMLLPPLMNIIDAILPPLKSILEALMPSIVKVVQTLLPPLVTLLDAIMPLLDAISPILKIVGDAIGVIVGWVGKLIELVASAGAWLINGISSLFSGGGGDVVDSAGSIPHNATGTGNFEGGWTHINELGGEMAYLPKGSQIIPADKSQDIADAMVSTTEKKTSSQGNTYQITVPVTIQGNVDTTVFAMIEAKIKEGVKQALEEAHAAEYNTRMAQGVC